MGALYRTTTSSVLLVVLSLSTGLSDASAGEIKPGAFVAPKAEFKGYDRPRIGLYSSLFARQAPLKSDAEYVVVEQHLNDSIFGSEVWIKIAPYENGTVMQEESVWGKWSDNGIITAYVKVME